MRLLDRFFPRHDIEFANSMARKIATRYPPNAEPKLKAQGGKKRLEGVLDTVLSDIENYQSKENMNWLRKARFGNAFRWQLADMGYSTAFVEALTEGMVSYLAAFKPGKVKG